MSTNTVSRPALPLGQTETLCQPGCLIVSQTEPEVNRRVFRLDSACVLSDRNGRGIADRSQADQILAHSSVAELRALLVVETQDRIQLTGNVRSFYHKQLAQEAMRPIAGQRLVVNRITVCN